MEELRSFNLGNLYEKILSIFHNFEQDFEQNMTESIILCGRFQVLKEIGNGGFSTVYSCNDISISDNSTKMFAIKEELKKTKYSVLWRELEVLKKLEGIPGVPKVHHHESYLSQKYIVMDLLGRSLEQLLTKRGGKFELKTVLLLANELLTLIERIHNKGFIHRDIKPENFLMTKHRPNKQVFAIDFGLAQEYPRQSESSKKEDCFKFYQPTSSIRGHLGMQQSRRDDLESIGYMLLYFLKGALPWQNLTADSTDEQHQKIKDIKIATKVESLCEGPYSTTFIKYLNYCKKLRFNEDPNYEMLRSLFEDLYCVTGYGSDRLYEWQETNNDEAPMASDVPVAQIIDIS